LNINERLLLSGLSIKISADAASAIEQFNALGASSETMGNKMAKAEKKFAGEYVDKFIDKQKLAQAAITAARGSTEALIKTAGGYQREIERLIKQGLSPESVQIKRLQNEYAGLQKQVQAVTGAEENHAKSAEKLHQTLANGANFTVIYRFLKETINNMGNAVLGAAAQVEDMTAAFTPLMGSADKAAGLVKRINTEAATTPFEIESISDSVKRLLPAFQGSADEAVQAFRMIGDTAGGNAQKLDTITNAYTKVMLTGKVGMEALNSIAGAGVPIFTELAASLGVTVTELSDMSSKGKITSDDLTTAFQRMTGEGGIFFQGMETASDTFNMRVLGLEENLNILAGTIGEKLLPAAKEMVGKAADSVAAFLAWAQEGENLDRLLGNLSAGIAAATAASDYRPGGDRGGGDRRNCRSLRFTG
jgi:tape measure domain-containing protein